MPIAFKEWAVTVRALAEGEQLLTLRKGGIREPGKHFALEHDRFFLYPTFDHQRNDLVRESHQPELRRALEEGVWPEGEPPARALTHGRRHPAARPRADPRLGRGGRRVDDHRPPRASTRCRPFHVWTTDYAEKRLAWKRRHPLHVLLLRTYRIPRPVTVRVRDDYGGCRSWLEITRDLPVRGHARCSRTRSSSAPPRRSRGSPTPTAPPPTRSRSGRRTSAGVAVQRCTRR